MSKILSTLISTSSDLPNSTEEKTFWQQWNHHKAYLYRCCIKWMGGNVTYAEDALSRAMIKAWEKAQQQTTKIADFKAWLTILTRNLCLDICREQKQSINQTQDIEIVSSEDFSPPSANTPNFALEKEE